MVGADICAVADPRSGVEPANRAELDQSGEMVMSEGVQWRSFVLDQRDFQIDINLTGTGWQGLMSDRDRASWSCPS